MKKVLFLFATCYLLLVGTPVFAEESKFETSYNINYTVFENGTTAVNQNIALKNKTDEFRPSQFTAELSLSDIRNIRISDSTGEIEPKIEKDQDKTKITFNFNDVVAGKDRSLFFKIYYETGELAKKNGLVWEVNIPGLADKSGIGEYNVSLWVPQSFGNPAFIKPVKNIADSKLFWTKDEISKGGVLVAFGEFQIYSLNLKYHLKNPRLYPIKTQIALPPRTNYQEVFINSLDPKPLDVDFDFDGNWLATYIVPSTQTLDINALVLAQVFLTPQALPTVLTSQERRTYLSERKYWEVNNKAIQDLAGSLKAPREIYNFVVSNLNYDLKRAEIGQERVGATGVLANKNSAVCMEFTDLFIALARSNGIPAREVNGFAWTEDESLRPLSLVRDVLHAWPQYYNSELQNWIMVDPTWGNTTGGLDYFDTLDFNHITFVIKGQNSEYPISAGGYKIGGVEEKDVKVNFGTTSEISEVKNLKINFDVPSKISSLFPFNRILVFENSGNALIKEQTITLKSQDFTPKNQQFQLTNIPPGGKEAINVKLNPDSLLTNKKAIIHVETPGYSASFETLVSPLAFSDNKIFLIIGGSIGAGLVTALLIKFTRMSWRLYLKRQQGKSALRREREQPQKPGNRTLQK